MRPIWKAARTLLAMTAVLSVAACSPHLGNVPRQHVLQFDRRGVQVESTTQKTGKVPRFRGATPEVEFPDRYFEEIEAGLESYAERCAGEPDCRILFFIHGGLNSNRAAMRRAMRLLCDNWKETATEPCDLKGPMLQDPWAYPVFVNWNSGLLSSYRDHLTRVQRGRDIGSGGWMGAPFKLVADSGRAAARLPIVDYEMLSHDAKTFPGYRTKTAVERDAECYYDRLEEAYERDREANSPVGRCWSDFSRAQGLHSALEYWPGLPFKLLLAPVIDTAGTVSWDVMLRRTDLLFDEEIFCAKKRYDCVHELVAADPLERVRAGGLAQFLDRLRAFIQESTRRWEITLVGHSMGGIVINKILERYAGLAHCPVDRDPPDCPDDAGLPIRNVVYLASAATVEDYKAAAFPLLRTDPEARVYHLVLSPRAELRERFKKTDWKVIDLAPRGSLLLWIDNFLSKPNSLEDRTAGRFANITRAMASTPVELKPRIHLTVFGGGKKVCPQPQKHGQFSDESFLEFWNKEWWFQDFSADLDCWKPCNTKPPNRRLVCAKK